MNLIIECRKLVAEQTSGHKGKRPFLGDVTVGHVPSARRGLFSGRCAVLGGLAV